MKEKYEFDNTVKSENEQFINYQYILDPKNLEQESGNILDKINLDDKNLGEERIKKILEEAKDDILKEIDVLKEQSHAYVEDHVAKG